MAVAMPASSSSASSTFDPKPRSNRALLRPRPGTAKLRKRSSSTSVLLAVPIASAIANQ